VVYEPTVKSEMLIAVNELVSDFRSGKVERIIANFDPAYNEEGPKGDINALTSLLQTLFNFANPGICPAAGVEIRVQGVSGDYSSAQVNALV